MRTVFLVLLLASAALYVGAQLTLTSREKPGVVQLRWATDKNPARTRQTAAFGEMFPGAEVVVDPADSQKLLVQCVSGWGPDIIDCYGIAHMQSLVEAGILLDLTEPAKEHGFAPEATYPAIEECLLVEGRQYRFPCNVWANCVIYNRRMLEDLGVPLPQEGWTYEDLVRIGKRIREASNGNLVPVANWNNVWLFEDMYIGAGGTYYRPGSHGLVSSFDSPEALAVMRFYHDMMHVHDVLPTPTEATAIASAGGWGSGGLTWFSGKKAVMIFIGRWYIVQLPNYRGLGNDLAVARLPSWRGRASRGQCDARAAGINAKGPHRDAAVKFLKYLASKEYGRIIVADGDSLPPNPELARTGENLVNDIVNDPAFHRPFVDAIRDARPVDTSPFIDAGLTNRWLKERIEQVENRKKTPEEAMRSLASEINLQIRANLEDRLDLQRKYESITGKPYTPDWWRREAPR